MNLLHTHSHKLFHRALLVLIIGLSACGNNSGSTSPTSVAIDVQALLKLTIDPTGNEIVILAGEERPIVANVSGKDIAITWTATCRRTNPCNVLDKGEGKTVFFTAPQLDGETVVITATAKDKANNEDNKTVTFKVRVPTATPTLTRTQTPSPIPTDTLVPTEPPTPSQVPVTNTPNPPTATKNVPTKVAASSLTLLSPQDNDSVPCTVAVRGQYANLKEPVWIWPVVHVISIGRYYPQDPPADMRDGEWTGVARFGDCNNPPNDVGLPFALLIVAADTNCNKVFNDYIQNGIATGDFPGLTSLPEECKVYQRIVVVKK